jgi:hypothetical protein
MTAVATRERDVRRAESRSAGPPPKRLFEPQGPTLEDAILATWHELERAEQASCPVCGAQLSTGGQCGSCRSRLS